MLRPARDEDFDRFSQIVFWKLKTFYNSMIGVYPGFYFNLKNLCNLVV